MNITDSILTSIKKLIGITEEDTSYDQDIIMHINSVISILKRFGIGPEGGYIVTDKYDTWDEYIPDENLELVKTYMYMKVRLIFDPPASSAAIETMKELISELEWRILDISDTII